MNHPSNSLQQTLHGVFIEVIDQGVLITGPSCIGKSELALVLIERGHHLIADDCVIISKNDSDELVGHCPPPLQDFLEVRGLGILNIRALFGDQALRANKPLQLIIQLFNASAEELATMDRLAGLHAQQNILGTEVAQVSIPVAAGRNLAILVESAVRNHCLKNKGYHASSDFIKRQQSFITYDRKHHDS